MASTRTTGIYVTNSLSSEPFKAFVPYPLPPEPLLNLSGEHYLLLDKATLALGRLDGVATQLPRDVVALYTYFYIRQTIPQSVKRRDSASHTLIL